MRLEVSDGRFTYTNSERVILNGINFSLSSKDILSILGPNGAGKTTLLKCIIGLLKWQNGETRIDGKSLPEINYRTLWKRISYVPQAKQVTAAYTVEEMVMLGRASYIKPFSMPSAIDWEMVNRSLIRTRIEHLRKRSCAELSGGELQMVLIARALASEPEVLILDEPESNLDYKNQLLVLDMISNLAEEGLICIFNTHYPAHALRRSTKALMLSPDGTYEFGPVGEVVTESNILKYFGVQAVIGEVETLETSYPDVVPIAVKPESLTAEKTLRRDRRVIAGITILMEGNQAAERLNEYLHEYKDELVGRMGLPYRRFRTGTGAGVNIITVFLDTTVERVQSLTYRISRLPSANVKATYMTGENSDE